MPVQVSRRSDLEVKHGNVSLAETSASRCCLQPIKRDLPFANSKLQESLYVPKLGLPKQ